MDAVPPRDDGRFAAFRNGRGHVHAIGPPHEEDRDLHITTEGLGNYSTSFYLDDERRRDVVDLMKRVRPKQPYLDAADRIVTGLRAYNAIHVRRGDFMTNELTRLRISRTATVTGREIRGQPRRPHGPGGPAGDLHRRRGGRGDLRPDPPGVPLHRVPRPAPREDAAIRHVVADLPREGQAVDALLTQLVAAAARTFFSTFTGLIHRMRGFADPHAAILYCYADFLSPLVRFERGAYLPVDDGPFTWNRVRYPISPDAYSWVREWPEAWCTVPASEPPFVGGLDLPAGAATLIGRALRCVEDVGGRPVLIDWTDPTDYPSWDMHIDEGGTYALEISYACPAESAGSTYTVTVGSGAVLIATVWNTGDWTSSSPWLPLGRVELAPGPAIVCVRARDRVGLAVMNLSGVRLRRVS